MSCEPGVKREGAMDGDSGHEGNEISLQIDIRTKSSHSVVEATKLCTLMP